MSTLRCRDNEKEALFFYQRKSWKNKYDNYYLKSLFES